MFEDFARKEFPERPEDCEKSFPGRPDGFIYAIFYVDEGRRVPFYVGQTNRLSERMEDYCLKQFAACTDFRVGEAIRYFKIVKKFQIVVAYRLSMQAREDEYTTIRSLQTSGVRLLNDLRSYNFSKANKDVERRVVETFCDVLVRTNAIFVRDTLMA